MKIIVFLVFFISTNLMSQNSSIEFDYGVSSNKAKVLFVYKIVGYGTNGEEFKLAGSEKKPYFNNCFEKNVKKDLAFKLDHIKFYYKPSRIHGKYPFVGSAKIKVPSCGKGYYADGVSGEMGVNCYIQYNIK